MEPARQAHVEVEPQIEGERGAPASGEAQAGRHLAIIHQHRLRSDREALRPRPRRAPCEPDEPEAHEPDRAAGHRDAPLFNGTTVSCTCWRRATFSFAISLLRRAICSLSSRLYRMFPSAGRGEGFFRVMMRPVTSAAVPATASSRLELAPRLPLSSPRVPMAAPPV